MGMETYLTSYILSEIKNPVQGSVIMAPHTSRNSALGKGCSKLSRSVVYKKRALYKRKKTGVVKVADKVETTKTKAVGGDKNGSERVVPVQKDARFYPVADVKKPLKTRKHPEAAKLRSSITPGTVLILVAGRHKGKRVVFLKQLESGLLLVTGPYHLNGCPLRRINQIYCLATKTKVDIKGVSLPDRLNDEYFKRQKLRKPKHAEGEIFDTKKEVYAVSDERKA